MEGRAGVLAVVLIASAGPRSNLTTQDTVCGEGGEGLSNFAGLGLALGYRKGWQQFI